MKSESGNIFLEFPPKWMIFPPQLGAVHILRQPPEGGEGVRQKLTIADEGEVESE